MDNAQLKELLEIGEPVPTAAAQAPSSSPLTLSPSGTSMTGTLSNNGKPMDAFFNSRVPNVGIMCEKPEHRVILMMKAQGLSNAEISRHVGYTQAWLSQLFRQPWARAILLQLMNETGVDELQTLLKGAAADSVLKLIDVRDNPVTPPAVVKSTCEYLLNRFLGTPAQTVTVKQATSSESVKDIDRELEELANEEKRLLGKN